MAALEALNEAVVDCRRCPRLVEWREQVAREKRAAYRDWDVLGPADAGLRRPGGAGADPRARARGARREPHRPDLHRRPLRATSCSPSLHRVGLANQAESIARGRRPAAARRLHGRRGALRAAREPADAGGARELLASGWSARSRCCPDVHVVLCLGGFAWESALRLRARARRRADAAPEAEVRPRRGRRRRAVAAARLLSPEPAEHVHRQADAAT